MKPVASMRTLALLALLCALAAACGGGGGGGGGPVIQPLTVSTATLPDGVNGSAYSATLASSGGTGTKSWAVTGSLPAGLTLNTATGVINGTPTATNTAGVTFTVTVTDTAAPPVTANKQLTIRVGDAASVTTQQANLPNSGSVAAGAAVNFNFAAAGGIGSFTWSISGGALPAGLTLSSAGVLSGTATASGTFNFTVQVRDSSTPPQTVTQAFTLTVIPQLVLNAVPLDGVTGVAYSKNLAASGGVGPYTWLITIGAPPGGLSLTNTTNGTISGTPSAAGSTTFTAQVTDSGTPQQTASGSVTIRIGDPLVITTTSLPDGLINTAYSQTIAKTGGTGTVNFQLTGGGTLPNGFTLSPTGSVTGMTGTGGTFNFTVMAVDSASPAQSTTQALSIIVQTPLSVSTTSLFDGVVGVAYNQSVTASGGEPPYTFSTDTLPANLAITAATGAITGTPTAAGTTNFQATVEDSGVPAQTASRGLSIRVVEPLVITTTTLPDGQAGTAYSQALSASGGVGTKTWGLTMGSNALPAGLTLLSSGTLTGTPSNGGTFTFTVMVSDQTNPAQSDTQDLSLTIAAAPLVITTTTLPNGILNVAYNQTLAASGGTLPFAWTVSAGSLPNGLNLNGSTGALTGTPTVANTFNFTVQVEDANTVTDTQDFSITISSVALGRNDAIANATPLSNGTHRASISPFTDPSKLSVDLDTYQFTANAGANVVIEIRARRLSPAIDSRLDSVIEVVNSNGQRFNTCRDIGSFSGVDGSPDLTPQAFDDACLNDDLDLGVQQDSQLEFLVPSNQGATVTFYVRVLDFAGRARPDFIYDLVITGVN